MDTMSVTISVADEASVTNREIPEVVSENASAFLNADASKGQGQTIECSNPYQKP
jgi:hypothetical protein